MPSSNVCWGIEIGSGSIKGLKLENTGDGVRVADFFVIEHKKVLSTPQLDQDDAMRVALGAMAAQVDLSGAQVVVSVAGNAALARFAKLPPVEPRGVPGIVKFEAKQQIPFPLEEVEWDYQTFISPDSPEIEVGIFAMRRQQIEERLALYADVGLVPDVLTPSPVAVYNAMAYDLEFSEQTPGTILLDIGTTSTDLIIAEKGRVWVRTFLLGGHHFTEALVEAFSLSYPKAEKLKREAETDRNARLVFQKMKPVFGDLAQEVQKSIEYYKSLHRDAKLTRLIGMGSTFKLPGMRRFLKQQLQMNVYRLESFKRLSVEGPRAGEFQDAAVNLAPAYGLALQGLGLATLEANLMPTAAVRQALWHRKVKWFGAAAAISAITAAAMFIRPFLDSQEVQANPPSPRIQQTIARAEALKSAAQDVTVAAAADYTAANMLALTRGREIYAHIVDDVARMLAAADEALAASPLPNKPERAFRLREMRTQNLGPGGRSTALQKPLEEDPTQRRRQEGFTLEDLLLDDTRIPRLEVRLVVETDVPDAQLFITQTLERWLVLNAEREGYPYRINKKQGDPASWRVTGRRVGERAAAPTTQTPAGAAPQARGPEGRPGFDPRDPRTMGRPPRGTQITGGGEEAGGPAGGVQDLETLAPLPLGPDEVVPPETTRTRFDVIWEIELVEPKKDGAS